jgi:hypothetical protein
MRLDPETTTLIFESADELDAFHAELSTLMRKITIDASSSSPDPQVATARAKEVLERFATITAALNAVRASGAVKPSPG